MSHSHTHIEENISHNSLRYKETVRVTLVGSVIDLSLGVAKIFGGYFAQSQALIADGIHSLSDLATDAAVLYAAKHSHRGHRLLAHSPDLAVLAVMAARCRWFFCSG